MLQTKVYSSCVPDKTVSRDRPLQIPRQPVHQARDPCRAFLGDDIKTFTDPSPSFLITMYTDMLNRVSM
jgi:hypothetical protein